jgi:hypothetical protein
MYLHEEARGACQSVFASLAAQNFFSLFCLMFLSVLSIFSTLAPQLPQKPFLVIPQNG